MTAHLRRLCRKASDLARDDRGYAMILTSLLLVPLMGFAGFAVDVGAWYSRGASLQRAADASALAGVVWMPDAARAESVAREAAARNGFVDGVDGIQVVVTGAGSSQLDVEIIDTDADMFFAGLFLDNVTIGRHGLAEYAAPVPMGSPANVIGAGTMSVGGGPASNAWAGMMGHCSPSSWGDLLSIASTDYVSHSDCGSYDNTYHRPGGYQWIVDVPAGHVGSVDINIFDGGYCTTRGGPNLPPRDQYNANLRTTLYNADSTPLDHGDNITPGNMLAQYTWSVDEGCNAWSGPIVHGMQINGGPGKYVVTTEILDSAMTQAYADTNDFRGQNYFSLWATSATHPGYCTTFSSTTCPGLYANDYMPVRTDSTSSPAVFYLAEIGAEHAGKTLQVEMWDLGEGMRSVAILDPNGNELDFDYHTSYSINGSNHSGDENSNPFGCRCLDVTGAVFNGDLVTVEIDLGGLDWTTFPNDWFQVRYVLDTSSVDWTTWSVTIIGDPVRLIE